MVYEDWFVYALIGLYIWLMFWRLKVIHIFLQRPYLRAWRAFATDSGLEFLGGSFFGTGARPPKIQGSYHGREVNINPDTRGRMGFKDSETHVTVSLENPFSRKYPMGGLLFVRAKAKPDKFFKELMTRVADRPETNTQDHPEFDIKSWPPSLGNYLLRTGNLSQVIAHPDFVGILIQQQNMYYQKKNLAKDSDDLHTLIDQLCELVDVFEKFAKIWMH